MSGICSMHCGYRDPDCRLCNTEARDILPDYDRKVAEAETMGEVTCSGCGFVFYRTTNHCPCCGRVSPGMN